MFVACNSGFVQYRGGVMNPSPNAQSESRADRGTWPAVSVIMPVLNEERHLADAVGRIMGQRYPGELGLILAGGPCRDRSHPIAPPPSPQNPHGRLVPHPRRPTAP